MKKQLQLAGTILFLAASFNGKAQSTYNSTDLAVNGDTIYLTGAQLGSFDFDSTGANCNWDYSTLVGNTQRILQWRAPNQTGFSIAQWPYLYNSSNVNTSSTDGTTLMVGNLEYSEPNDYYLKNSGALEQKASSYKIGAGSQTLSIKNVFTSADVIYKFPLNYGNVDSSLAAFTTSVSSLYNRSTSIKRVNDVSGWGTITTPYGTFSNALKLESYIMQIDSIVVDTFPPYYDTLYSRELKWLDPSKGYAILTVLQTKVGSNYVTSKIEYMDNRQYFQPNALFVYYPVSPFMGDTVLFQNLSTNATDFSWDFGDPGSGINNTSINTNPQHTFANPGVYNVTLIAYNGVLADTVIIPINVRDTVPPTASFSYLPATVYEGDTVYFTNNSTHYTVSTWNFGDPGSGNNISALDNPNHAFATAGTYTVRLIASNSISADTLDVNIMVNAAIGIKENNTNTSVKVYPVPATDKIYFSGISNNNASVTIYDLTGKKLAVKTLANGSIDVSSFNNGIYFIESENIIKRIVINH